MSGHKIATVTISQEEYRKLFEAEKNLRKSISEMERPLQEIIPQPDLSIYDQLMDFYSQARDAEVLPRTVSTSPDHEKELARRDQVFQQNIGALEEKLQKSRNAFNQLQVDHDQHISILSSQLQELRETIQIVNQNVSRQDEQFNLRRSRNDDRTEFLLDEIGGYLELIEQHPHRQLVDPAAHQQMLEYYDKAIENLENGFTEAAIALFDHAGLIAKRLWRLLGMEDAIWRFQVNNIVQSFYQLKCEIEQNAFTEALTIDGSQTGISLNLDDWSDRRYQNVLENLAQIESWIENYIEQATFADLEHLEETVQAISRNYEESIHIAHKNAINSELKFDVARQVLLALVEQGYVPEAGDYVDYRGQERYQAKARNANGSVVDIIVDADPEVEVGNILSIYSSDSAIRSRYELEKRGAEIRESVQQYGLLMSELKETGEPKANSRRNQRPLIQKDQELSG